MDTSRHPQRPTCLLSVDGSVNEFDMSSLKIDTRNVEIVHGLPTPPERVEGNNERNNSLQEYPFRTTSCPVGAGIYKEAMKEFSTIRSSYRTFASTGCTKDFCQSGRATKTDEPRVGRDRPIAEIQREAREFLQECRDKDILKSDEELCRRVRTAMAEITKTSIESTVMDNNGQVLKSLAGGIWTQTPEELEYGIRASWKHAKRCIMRSEHYNLALCDLRHITSSREMATSLIAALEDAFNGGRIVPTAFMFPPRSPGKRGPMIWNEQILAFAGYRQSDGSVLGDPKNVDLTEAMIELGWQPPQQKTRFDVLPLVTMAEGDDPYLVELPSELTRLVKITHPTYPKEFDQLNLKWIMFPALSRLGFDIGGVQYTASPFVGWFMDAEIGVRNLADVSRYNTLPEIVKTLRLSNDPEKPIEDLPEYIKLAALSRAQAELNLAVYHSYTRAQVTMVDTLTASMEYSNFDDDHKAEFGHRLPADPYWLAPPQGSIVPLWHRGAAPNFQPKPMICRHVQDPVRAWRRERTQGPNFSPKDLMVHLALEAQKLPRLHIYSCSAGVTARKLAQRLQTKLSRDLFGRFSIERERPLDALRLSTMNSEDVILIIASTTGRGEIPRNAQKFWKVHSDLSRNGASPRFSVFGNGDSTYGDTYNKAAEQISQILATNGARDLLGQFWQGDTAISNPDWVSFNEWTKFLSLALLDKEYKDELASARDVQSKSPGQDLLTGSLGNIERYQKQGLSLVSIDVGTTSYSEMSHIKLLVPNTDDEVEQALAAMGLSRTCVLPKSQSVAWETLSQRADLSQPFRSMEWLNAVPNITSIQSEALVSTPAFEILRSFKFTPDRRVAEQVIESMTSISPKIYSIASSLATSKNTNVDILVKHYPGGRFSDRFLGQASHGSHLKFTISRFSAWPTIQGQEAGAPLIAFVTGSGLGPFRSVLQHRIAKVQQTSSATSANDYRKSTSLFAGFKAEDTHMINDLLAPSKESMLFDMLELVPSNLAKERVQDRLLNKTIRESISAKLRQPGCVVFVCTNEQASRGVASNLSVVVGQDIRSFLGNRYIEEAFHS